VPTVTIPVILRLSSKLIVIVLSVTAVFTFVPPVNVRVEPVLTTSVPVSPAIFKLLTTSPQERVPDELVFRKYLET
jgi:hypothetical protein